MNIDKLSLLYKKIHLIRLALVLIGINLLIFIALVIPNHSRISDLQTVYAAARNEAMDQQNQNRELQRRIAALEQAQKDVDEIYSKVLVTKKKGATDIRLELETLTQSLQVHRLEVGMNYHPMPDFKLQYYKLSVPVEGSYNSIRRFINKIERSKHFLILERVDLTAEKKKAEMLNLDFQLSTYLVDDEI